MGPTASFHIHRVLVSPLQPLRPGMGRERVTGHKVGRRLIGEDLQSPLKPLL